MVKNKLLYIKVFFFIFFLFVVIAVILAVKTNISDSAYFCIKKIIIKGIPGIEPPREFLGKNIFNLDLKEVEKKLYFKYPQLRDIIISRYLPGTLLICARSRMPVLRLNSGHIKSGRVYLIDRYAAFLELPYDKKYDSLPKVYGLEGKLKRLFTGGVIKDKGLFLALNILREYAKMGDFKGYTLENIDVSDLSAAFFEVRMLSSDDSEDKAKAVNRLKAQADYIKIIIGSDDTGKKMSILRSLISKIKSNLAEIKYIDLRFKNPVTGGKDADR